MIVSMQLALARGRRGYLKRVEQSLVVIFSEWELIRVLLVFINIYGTMTGPSMVTKFIYTYF